MKMQRAIAALVAVGLSFAPGHLLAQERSYMPGTVWVFSYVKTEPGQFESYMDYLDSNYKKVNEFLKKEGNIVSYHVFGVNNARKDEPDIILAIEYKDYTTTAEQLAIEKKVDAMLVSDPRKQEAQYGERKVLRHPMGSIETQELKLK